MIDEGQTEVLRGLMPFAGQLGIQVVAASPAEVSLALDWKADLCTVNAALHGGVLMSLADCACATAAQLNLPENARGTTTVEAATHFFRAVRDGRVQARARVLHAGKRFIVIEAEVSDAGGAVAAKTVQTQAVLR